jgi:hypothetical protein
MMRCQVTARARRASSWIAAFALAAGMGVGCNDESSSPNSEAPDPAGTWEHVYGQLPLLNASLPTGVSLRYLVLAADQTGSVHAQMLGTGGGAWCQDLIYFSTLDAGIVLQIYDDGGHVQHKLLFGFEAKADTLRLGDGRGHTAVFAAREAVAAELDCPPVLVVSRLELHNYPALGTGLAFDGTALIYTREEPETILDRIDPDTGSLLSPLSLPFPFTLVQATEQQSTFWTVCRCSPAVAVRRDADGDELDRVDTALFPNPINIRALAHDEDGNTLWLHGLDASGPSRLLRVDSDADPNILVRSISLDLYLEAMTWYGGALWAVDSTAGRQALVEIDPELGRVVRTFRSPDPDLSLRAIGAAGQRLFLLTRDPSTDNVFLLEIAP